MFSAFARHAAGPEKDPLLAVEHVPSMVVRRIHRSKMNPGAGEDSPVLEDDTVAMLLLRLANSFVAEFAA